MNRKESFMDRITSVPVLIAAVSAGIIIAGTFLEIGKVSAFGFSYPFGLHELSLDRQVLIARLISLAAIVFILIPNMPRYIYSLCGAVLFAQFVPKALKALKAYREAQNVLQATGLSQYFDIRDYFQFSAGYYLLIIGFLAMLGCAVWFMADFFRKQD